MIRSRDDHELLVITSEKLICFFAIHPGVCILAMYKEYRDTSLIGAVKQCYSEMAGTHRARDRSIQIIKTAVVADEDLRRHQNVMYTHENVKYALPHRQYRAESKKYRSTFLATRPSTCRR